MTVAIGMKWCVWAQLILRGNKGTVHSVYDFSLICKLCSMRVIAEKNEMYMYFSGLFYHSMICFS